MLRNENNLVFKMALSNAERQKLYRQKRKEQVFELDTLRNEITLLRSELDLTSKARNNFSNHNRDMASEIEKLRNENQKLRAENEKLRTLRKKSPKLIEYVTEETAFFYVESGELKLLQWPETIGTLNARKIQTTSYSKIDKKFRSDMDKLILSYNENAQTLNQDLENAP